MKFGCQSEVGQIKILLLKHPRDAFLSQENIQAQWRELNYSACPDYGRALEEYEYFVGLLKKSVAEVYFLPRSPQTGLDSIYVHDPVLITSQGAVLGKMGKEQRQGEPGAVRKFLLELKIPILGSISGEGRLEGGDVVWVDERIVAVGRGYRTNDEGIRQFAEIVREIADEIFVVPLPHWKGPEDVLHLMSLISPVDRDLAVVYSRLLPVAFREWLVRRGIRLLEVPDSEFEAMAGNILAVSPRKCIMLSGSPLTKRMLEKEGIEVWEYGGEEISRKGAGGPTCLTRPLLREKD
jgi:N-dimethylarginine dimethylaminohydrolase